MAWSQKLFITKRERLILSPVKYKLHITYGTIFEGVKGRWHTRQKFVTPTKWINPLPLCSKWYTMRQCGDNLSMMSYLGRILVLRGIKSNISGISRE